MHTMECYSAKREWHLAICNNMNGSRGYYAKWYKTEKDKYDFTNIQNLKNKPSQTNTYSSIQRTNEW